MFAKFLKYAIITVGAAFMGLALNLFLVPSNIAPGGVSGLSTVVHYLTDWSMGVLIFTINIPIFILGWIHFGRKFILSSIYGTVALSVFADLFAFVPAITSDMILSSVFGGGLLGLGLGMVLRTGATTGGSDIIAKVIYKKYPAASIGQIIMAVDAFVIAFAGIVFKQWEVILYSAVGLYASSYIVDAVVEGLDFAKTVFIISDKSEEISEYILRDMRRGVTALSGSSMYTNDEKLVLMCVLKKFEINKLKMSVKDIDPNAFVILTDVREVLGQGFKT